MKVKGTVIKYGNNVDTDVIIPARYLNTSEPSELAKYCMEDLDKTFVTRVNKGDIMVAGRNFGCGSSREHAPIALKASGISCIIAENSSKKPFSTADGPMAMTVVRHPICKTRCGRQSVELAIIS